MKLDTACVGLGCLRSCQTLTVLRGRKKEGCQVLGCPGDTKASIACGTVSSSQS